MAKTTQLPGEHRVARIKEDLRHQLSQNITSEMSSIQYVPIDDVELVRTVMEAISVFCQIYNVRIEYMVHGKRLDDSNQYPV